MGLGVLPCHLHSPSQYSTKQGWIIKIKHGKSFFGRILLRPSLPTALAKSPASALDGFDL